MHKPCRFLPCLLIVLACWQAACGSSPASPSPATATAQAQRAMRLATAMGATAQAGDARALATQAANEALIQQAQQWPVRLAESFDNNAAQWPEGQKEEDLAAIHWEITGGQYLITATAQDGFIWRAGPDSLSAFTDFYLAADMQQVSGPDTGEAGLVFRVTENDEYYLFEINPQRQCAIYIYAGQTWEELFPWTETVLLLPNQPNRLAVVGQAGEFLFLINGQFLTRLEDTRLPIGSTGVAIGLYNKSDAGAWKFDNFELRSPQAFLTPTPPADLPSAPAGTQAP